MYVWRPSAPGGVRTLFKAASDWGKEPALKKGEKKRHRFMPREEEFALRCTLDLLLHDDPAMKARALSWGMLSRQRRCA